MSAYVVVHRHSYLVLFDFANEAVIDVNILLSNTVLADGCFMYDNLFNQRIQKLCRQLSGTGVSLDKGDP